MGFWSVALTTICVGGSLLVTLSNHVLLNTTPSAPLGLYWFTPLVPAMPLPVGQVVRVTPPAWIRTLIHEAAPSVHAERPWLKTIVAGTGDTVCLDSTHVTVNGCPVGERPLLETYALPPLSGCVVIQPDEYFVMSGHPRSFDSRYVGSLPRTAIDGTATPLWTWEARP